ncbi:MAG: four helix bundle protein [Bacteroidota bacterium]
MKYNTFKDLKVWEKSHHFVLKVYQMTESFPKSEIYGLTSQFRRAAISVPANIAEGYTKISLPDKIRYYNIARSSLEECRYYSILSNDLNYIHESIEPGIEEISKMLSNYIRKLKETKN